MWGFCWVFTKRLLHRDESHICGQVIGYVKLTVNIIFYVKKSILFTLNDEICIHSSWLLFNLCNVITGNYIIASYIIIWSFQILLPCVNDHNYASNINYKFQTIKFQRQTHMHLNQNKHDKASNTVVFVNKVMKWN